MFPAVLFCASLLALPPEIDPALFPDLDTHTSADVEMAGLAQLYPGHVLHSAPKTADPANLGRAPLTLDLPRNISFVRLYNFEDGAITKLAAELTKPALIVDLRNLSASAKEAEVFAQTLMKSGLVCGPVKALGDIAQPEKYPELSPEKIQHGPLVLALVNGQTAGPLEAWLAAFQEKESVLVVGTTTAGQPGDYQMAESAPGYHILRGELQPSTGSIAGVGLKPRFMVDVTPEQSALAYSHMELGMDTTQLLRHDHSTSVQAPATTTGNATTAAPPPLPAVSPAEDTTDAALQRAVDVVAALQLLGRAPSSNVPAATSSTAPAAPAATTNSSSTKP